MKLYLKLLLCIIIYAKYAFASLIEPWRTNISPALTLKNNYTFAGSIILSENYFEMPLTLYYGIENNFELNVRWGFIYGSPKIYDSRHTTHHYGISDLKFALKYNFTEKSAERPCIFMEMAISLPTADHTKKLGSGAVGISAGWFLIKEFDAFDIFFGIAGEFNGEVLEGANPPRVFSYKLGASRRYDEKTIFVGEIKGFNNYWKQPRGFRQELYLAPGIHYSWSIPISASLLVGLTEDSKKIGVYAETKFGK